MTSKALRELPEGSYLTIRASRSPHGETETVRLLGIREPDERELNYGHTQNRVQIRRFLLGGPLDTWVLPGDVAGVAEPDEGLLRAIEISEAQREPKVVAQ